MIFAHTFAFSCGLIYSLQYPKKYPLPTVLGNLSYCMTALVGTVGFFLFHRNRDSWSKVVQRVNEKNLMIVQRSDSIKYRSARNRVHLVCIGLCAVFQILCTINASAHLIEFLLTGKVLIKYHWTANSEPYSASSLLYCLYHIVISYYILSFYTGICTMIVEIFLSISLNYRILANDLRAIEVGKADVEQIFKRLMIEIQDLQW